jgi:hypothetical protein
VPVATLHVASLVIAVKFANSGWLCHNPRARRPADQGLPWRRRSAHQHDPEKWIPVFGKDHAEMQTTRAGLSTRITQAIALAIVAAGYAGGIIRRAKCPR